MVNGISWFILIGIGITFILTICYCGENGINIFDKEDKDTEDVMKFLGILKKVAIVVGMIIISASVIPTKQTLLLMGGTYLGRKAINTVVTDEKMKKIDTIINLQLDKYIKDLKQEVK